MMELKNRGAENAVLLLTITLIGKMKLKNVRNFLKLF